MGVADKEPLISVIIPIVNYNSDRSIKAIESVLQQQDCHFEVIVVDDGSSNQIREVIKQYGNSVQYTIQNNQGIAEARNLGIAQAKGDLIVFLDANHYFLPEKLATHSAIFKENPDIGIVHSGWQRVNSQNNKTVDVCPWKDVSELDLAGWLRWKPVFLSAMMFRREWLEYLSGFDPFFAPADDTDLILRMALKGCKTTWLEKITVGYHQEDNTKQQSLLKGRSLSLVINRFFAQPDLPSKIKLMEYSVLYSTNVWIAWDLYQTKDFKEMTNYLKQSCQYTPFSPVETTINWIESFTTFSKNWAVEFDVMELTDSQEWQDLAMWIIKEYPLQTCSI